MGAELDDDNNIVVVEVESTVEVVTIELTFEAELKEFDDADDIRVVEVDVEDGLTVELTGLEVAGAAVGTIDEMTRL